MRIKKNGKVIRLTESDLNRIVKRVLNEEKTDGVSPCHGEVFESDICSGGIRTEAQTIVNNIAGYCNCFGDGDWDESGVHAQLLKIGANGILWGDVEEMLLCYMRGGSESVFKNVSKDPIQALILELSPKWQIFDDTNWGEVERNFDCRNTTPGCSS